MPNWTIYLVISIIFILIFILFSNFKKNYIKKMSTILYQENNADEFIHKINSFEGKVLISNKIRLFRLIDAYALKQDKEKVIETFKTLEKMKLSFGQEVTLYEKEVVFYVENNMYDVAKIANDKIQELNKKVEIPDLNKIAVNCESLIKIYVNKDGSLANEMVKAGDESKIGIVKGTYYFRAAKCFYYKKDNKMVEKYLEKAFNYLHQTSLNHMVSECIKDHTKLD